MLLMILCECYDMIWIPYHRNTCYLVEPYIKIGVYIPIGAETYIHTTEMRIDV